MKLLILLALFPAITLANIFSYEGYKVYQITVKDQEEAKVLPILRQNVNYDFLSDVQALNHPINILVTPDAQDEFVDTLKTNSIEFSIIDEDLERNIKLERERLSKNARLSKGRISFTEYHRYPVIQDYLNELAVKYPDITSVETFGTSLEGRPLTLIRIGSGSSNNPTILIECGIHAREWIAPAVTLYVVQQLVENENNRELVENINWIIVPVLNPDGYEFSFTGQRLWRKTRRPGFLGICNGVDGNRNFDFHWGGLGTSTNQCSEIFIGPSPHSEPEVASFTEVALAAENLVLYLSIHSFGNWLLYPWGWTNDPIENAVEHQQLGEAVAAAIQSVNGTRYVTGASSTTLYFAAGNSQDWAASIGATLSYTIELPAGNGGGNGFIVAPERIIPISEETWPGFVVYAKYVIDRWQSKK